MLKLKPNEACPYASNCPYNNKATHLNSNCIGADSSRTTEFICDLIDSNGVFVEGKFRSSYDKTGKMKIIVE